MRHGIAEPPAAGGEIELTAEGARIVRATLEALRRCRFDAPQRIIASPLKRAQQTANITKEVLRIDAEITTLETLVPDADPIAALSAIAALDHREATMLVGHDPLFSTLASMLVAGTDIPVISMSKSSICAIELTRFDVPRMRGVLRLFLPPVKTE